MIAVIHSAKYINTRSLAVHLKLMLYVNRASIKKIIINETKHTHTQKVALLGKPSPIVQGGASGPVLPQCPVPPPVKHL